MLTLSPAVGAPSLTPGGMLLSGIRQPVRLLQRAVGFRVVICHRPRLREAYNLDLAR
jgi:hypothetical protein